MDVIFEFLIEIIFEGVIELAKSRRIPLPFRILAAVIIIALYGGVIFLIVWAGIGCFNSTDFDGGKIFGVLLFIAAAGLTGAVIWQFIKVLHRHDK